MLKHESIKEDTSRKISMEGAWALPFFVFVVKPFKALPPSFVELYNTLSLATVTLPMCYLKAIEGWTSGHCGPGKPLEN